MIGVATILSGCGGGVCTGWKAIYVSNQDELTPKTEAQILKHNRYGKSLSCSGFVRRKTRLFR